MSNLKTELIITTTWLCNNRGQCGAENKTVVNTADFTNYVPARIMADCPHCGEMQVIWIGGEGYESAIVSATVAAEDGE